MLGDDYIVVYFDINGGRTIQTLDIDDAKSIIENTNELCNATVNSSADGVLKFRMLFPLSRQSGWRSDVPSRYFCKDKIAVGFQLILAEFCNATSVNGGCFFCTELCVGAR